MKKIHLTTPTLLSLLSLAALIQPVHAADYYWEQIGSTASWNDTANWSPATVPGPADRGLVQSDGATAESTTLTLSEDTVIDRLQVQKITGSGQLTATVEGNGHTLTINESINTGGLTDVILNSNVNYLGGNLSIAAGTTQTYGSGYALTAALSVYGEGTLNLYSSTLNAGSSTTALRVFSGSTANWDVGTFNSTSTSYKLFNVEGRGELSTLNFMSSVDTLGGITMGSTTSYDSQAAVFGINDGVVIADNIKVADASTGGTSLNVMTVGANDSSASVGSPSTVTFTGNYTGNDINARSHVLHADANNIAVFSGTISAVMNAGSTVTKDGLGTVLLSGANTYNAPTTVSAGTLLVNNATGSATGLGTVTIAADATLGGNGFIGGATTIAGILAPGNSIGTLTVADDVTWDSNNAWQFELGTAAVSLAQADLASGTANDRLTIVGGDLLKGSGTGFAFDLLGTGEEGWYKLVEWDGTSDFTGSDFSSISLSSGLLGDFVLDVGTSALYFNVASIPEPSAISLIFGASAMVVVCRRRRKNARHA
jgi:fibronectin-binding autotransporter adhesin